MRLDFTPAVYPGRFPVHLVSLGGEGDGYYDNLTANKVGQGLVSAGTIGTQTALTTGSNVAGAIAGGLSAAALFDPEPISRAILTAAAGMVAVVTRLFSGCGPTCTQTTQIVNQVEAQYLKPNIEKWKAQRFKLASVQRSYEDYFNQAWNIVLRQCGNPAMGDAGRRCISERQRGGSAPWCPTTTGCDWFALYLDPIANDPDVVPDNATPISIDTTNNTLTFQTVSGGTVTVPVSAALIAEQMAGVTTSNGPGATGGNDQSSPVGGGGVGEMFSSIPAPLLLGGALIGLYLIAGGGQ